MRIILYTGKGGVGKTTLSAATGVQAAKQGHRTLIISTDPAHSLSDSFDLQLGDEPTLIRENLWGQEINVLKDIHRYWGDLQASLSTILVTKGFDDVVADELAVMPGMEEVCSLLHLNEKAQSGEFDCIILDCAPTGETIRLISMPDIVDWYMKKMFDLSFKGTGIFEPVIKTALALPGQKVSRAVDTLFAGVAEVQKRLMDPKETSIRIVLTPEKMVLKEALRSFSYFSLFGYNVDQIMLNRLVTKSHEDNTFLQSLKTIQEQYVEQAQKSFSPIPIRNIPLFGGEIVGLSDLDYIGEIVFPNGEDPTRILFDEQVQAVEKKDGKYVLKRRFPPFEINKFDLRKKGDELIFTYGNVRRSIILPTTLAMLEPCSADFKDGELQIVFS